MRTKSTSKNSNYRKHINTFFRTNDEYQIVENSDEFLHIQGRKIKMGWGEFLILAVFLIILLLAGITDLRPHAIIGALLLAIVFAYIQIIYPWQLRKSFLHFNIKDGILTFKSFKNPQETIQLEETAALESVVQVGGGTRSHFYSCECFVIQNNYRTRFLKVTSPSEYSCKRFSENLHNWITTNSNVVRSEVQTNAKRKR